MTKLSGKRGVKLFRAIFWAAVFSLIQGSIFSGDLTGLQQNILATSDRLLFPAEASYNITLRVNPDDPNPLDYALKVYSSGPSQRRAVWIKPDYNKNDLAVKSKDLVIFKYHQWHKADTLSAKSSFLESAFSWEDILNPSFSADYTVQSAIETNLMNSNWLYCELKPIRPGLYARIGAWFSPGNILPYQKDFYTPSGKIYKVAQYKNINIRGGRTVSFILTMKNLFTGAEASAMYENIKQESSPVAFFDPENLKKENGNDRIKRY